MLGLFGMLVALAGVLLLIVPHFDYVFRLAIGMPVLMIGAVFLWIALRSTAKATREPGAAHELQGFERLTITPPLGAAVAFSVLLLFHGNIVFWVRLPVLAITVLTAVVLTYIARGRLPERFAAPDIDFENTDD